MNRFLKLLFLGQSANTFADHLLIPIYALFVAEIGGSVQLAGLLWATQAATSALIGLLVLRIKDKPRLDFKLVQINYLIKSLAWSLLVFSPTIPGLFVAQLMIGFASAVGSPSLNALISEHLDKDKHIKDWGAFSLASNLVVAVAAAVSGFVAAASFTYIFIAMAALELVSLAILTKAGRIKAILK